MFTDEQNAIIRHRSGHARVSAVAGSGKTTTMIGRISHLLREGINPKRILVLMFNKEAQLQFLDNMRDKLANEFPVLPDIRTFHAFAYQLTGLFSKAGFLPDWTLETRGWVREMLIREAIKQVSADDTEPIDLDEFEPYLELRKATLNPAHASIKEFDKVFAEVFNSFEALRQEKQIRFFEDLLVDVAMTIQQNDEAAAYVAGHKSHIIVDEFQDANDVQTTILKAVAKPAAEVMVVGDLDQTIYEWRGADPAIMHKQFEMDFPDATRYSLSHTFRFGHRLSLMANHLLVHNRQREEQLCISHPGNIDTQVEVVAENTGSHPFTGIARNWKNSGRQYSEIMVLCRLWSMAMPVEIACLTQQIPYQLKGGSSQSFLRSREFMALTGFMRLHDYQLFNRTDTVEILTAMLEFPKLYLTNPQKQQLINALSSQRLTIEEAFYRQAGRVKAAYQQQNLIDNGRTWQRIASRKPSQNSGLALQQIINELDLESRIEKTRDRDVDKDNQLFFVRTIRKYAADTQKDVSGFLAFVDQLYVELDNEKDESDKVIITTIHRTKGLEAPLVYLPGITEGQFPYYHESYSKSTEAERRLFYVGMTRAREQLYLGVAQSLQELDRYFAHTDNLKYPSKNQPSRFIYEINPELSDKLCKALHKQDWLDEAFYEVKIANRYLQQLGINKTLKAKARPVTGRDSMSKGNVTGATPVGRRTFTASPRPRKETVFGPGIYDMIRKDLEVSFLDDPGQTYTVERIWRSAVSRSETVRLFSKSGDSLELTNNDSNHFLICRDYIDKEE